MANGESGHTEKAFEQAITGRKLMNDQQPLYNSRVNKAYIDYLRMNFPQIHINSVLKMAGIADYEIEDSAHWFTQEQQDRLHDILVAETGDADIARKVGRFVTSSESAGTVKQYSLGLMNPTAIYLLMEKLYPLLSRGADVSSRKIGPETIEIISIPKPGVKEKSYQCQYRTGTFEAAAKWFTSKYAKIEHPACLHKGDDCCRYIITWEKTKPYLWKRTRNFFLLFSLFSSAVAFFVLPMNTWAIITLLLALLSVILAFNSERLEAKSLTKTIEIQRGAAEDNLFESDIRYNNAMLIQEIGQVASKILSIDDLIRNVVTLMEKRLDFDRGMIMLANKDRTRLQYSAGYGQSEEQKAYLRQTAFSLDKPDSQGLFVMAMRDHKPFLVSDVKAIEGTLSRKSRDFAKRMASQSLICVPIVYETEALGILAVDNSKSKTPLKQSDLSLLMGVASQLAISITNARSFKKLEQSESKYRELVETANSIIMRMDTDGKITFFNEFAQRFLGYSESDILGKNADSIMYSDTDYNQNGFHKMIGTLGRDPEASVVNENEALRRNGEKVWMAWAYKPIFDSEGNFREILCIGNDISELKRADREKKELQAQLQRAQKMEAIGTLAGGVAHDLNNILSGIVSYPELLLMDLPPNSPLTKPILTIQKSGEKAAAIVQDLL
ncbi:MAG: PAS domain S-box protein, partial [Deltaproteobacteria bacterium]|nr:PAS domain S-box protein [Deltaproteobacteria bacterium]